MGVSKAKTSDLKNSDQRAVFVIDLSVVDERDMTTDDCEIYRHHFSPSEAV